MSPLAIGLFPFFALVDFSSPLLWGLVIGWIMTVILHEFAHGIVAYWGGDYTIRERGGLTLNPLQYVDPVMSIGMPLLFLLIGGVPLPGGATYINRSLLRSRYWECAVSLAGPMMNLLILIVLCVLTHPALGLFDLSKPVEEWTNAQVFGGALAFSQAFAIVLNLIPCPPLDGFNALAPFLPRDFVERVTTPPMSFILFAAYFLVITRVLPIAQWTYDLLYRTLRLTGQDGLVAWDFWRAFEMSIRGS